MEPRMSSNRDDEDASNPKKVAPHQQQVEKRGTRRTRNTARSKDNNVMNHSNMGPGDDPVDVGAAMLLSMIDEESYERAMLDDSECIMQNHLLPNSLPWSKPRVALLRTLPRDIEDMQGVWHAGGDGGDEIPRTDNNSGQFGYGMFDMGGLRKEDVKGTRADTIISARNSPQAITRTAPLSPRRQQQQKKRKTEEEEESDSDDEEEDEYDIVKMCKSNEIEAAARRGSDKGVIELKVKLPLPSLEWSLLKCQHQNILPRDPELRYDEESVQRAKIILQSDRAEKCSSMPLYWHKIDRNNFKEPPAFVDISDDEGDAAEASSSFHKRMKIREKRKRKISSLSKACTRTWKVSVKVAGVSSRASISRPETRPMYCNAVFPTYVQSGQTLTLESAKLKDEKEGLRDFLGSYDCRATTNNRGMSLDAMDGPESKKKEGSRSRRINVGRTRLIWSKANIGSQKVAITSLFNGQKLDAASYKRPKELKVTIRLNGRVISVVDNADITSPTSYIPKQKRSTGNLFTEKFKWAATKVNEAVNFACKDAPTKKLHVIPNSTQSSSESSEGEQEELDTRNAFCIINTEDYIRDVSKNLRMDGGKGVKKQKEKSKVTDEFKLPNASADHDSAILQQTPPRFICAPLDDGFIRTECESPGSMRGSNIGKLLNHAAKKKAKADDADAIAGASSSPPLCTVCWTGSGTYQVLECGDCGLLAHQDCCLGVGDFKTDAKSNNDWVWKCAMCKEASKPQPNRMRLVSNSSLSASSSNGSVVVAAAAPGPVGVGLSSINGSRKSQRTPRLPHRFKDKSEVTSVALVPTKNLPYETVYKCTLCPHAGGAMSMSTDGSFRWTHDICRVWSLRPQPSSASSSSSSLPPSSPPSIIPGTSPLAEDEHVPVCCLCGMGLVHNKGRDNQEILEEREDEEGAFRIPGLVKCAAAGCNITFHPMCALLASKFGTGSRVKKPRRKKVEDYGGQNESLRRDVELCQQFTLQLTELSRMEGSVGHHPGSKKTYTVPIAFCGFHNPNREASFYGCLPCAEPLSDNLMCIPYQINTPQTYDDGFRLK